ncbi:MAG TPA: hypothetical protein VNK70_01220 [Candidatus Paceibacterota bacterium]|nr:hypothetical protein [Candidatus Paceibacterota bacterium]
MFKNFAAVIIAVLLIFASSASAQSPAVQDALQGVKGQVQSLVTAKDEGKTDDLSLRIETFKKVLEFSVSEAKDLKVKLLALDKLPEETALWRDGVVKTINTALDYYESQAVLFEDENEISLEEIKKIASDFKSWREKNYLAAVGEADSYLLISQEQKALETAEKRWQRIQKDVLSLQKARIKNASKLKEMLEEAGKKISEAKNKNSEASGIFWNAYVMPYAMQIASNQTSTTSSVPIATATTSESATASTELIAATSDTTSSTSTAANASSSQVIPTPSIKDLVESSLNDIKGAYQIFIEMGNLVRKLLD